ncbi:MAG TPA: DUF1223 domain-containing protein [Gammaproteobacteria bacterium]|nr:DUF1223 domain-containing protein [Gammaproteobacteria bacterium]
MWFRRIVLFSLMLIVQIGRVEGAPMKFTSPVAQVQLVELYTSEGCSSCPPADRWLSGFTQDARLWRDIVPVAFHVDYWNYLGWEDRFASPVYSERQQHYVQAGGVSQVYTPGIVVQGREWRGWFSKPDLELEAGRPVGQLQVELGDDHHGEVSFEPSTTIPADAIVNVALLGFGLATDIKNGENSGRTLHHDFVVLGLTQAPLKRDGDHYVADIVLPGTRQEVHRLGFAAWISGTSNPAPLQAVGGWLDGK